MTLPGLGSTTKLGLHRDGVASLSLPYVPVSDRLDPVYAAASISMQLFEEYEKVIGTLEEERLLKAVYEVMPTWNFSSHLLQRVPNQIAVIELNGLLWSDWGTPKPILETLHRIGKCPVFPSALTTAV